MPRCSRELCATRAGSPARGRRGRARSDRRTPRALGARYASTFGTCARVTARTMPPSPAVADRRARARRLGSSSSRPARRSTARVFGSFDLIGARRRGGEGEHRREREGAPERGVIRHGPPRAADPDRLGQRAGSAGSAGSAVGATGSAPAPRVRSSACTMWRWSASDANQSRGNAIALAPSSTTSTGADAVPRHRAAQEVHRRDVLRRRPRSAAACTGRAAATTSSSVTTIVPGGCRNVCTSCQRAERAERDQHDADPHADGAELPDQERADDEAERRSSRSSAGATPRARSRRCRDGSRSRSSLAGRRRPLWPQSRRQSRVSSATRAWISSRGTWQSRRAATTS